MYTVVLDDVNYALVYAYLTVINNVSIIFFNFSTTKTTCHIILDKELHCKTVTTSSSTSMVS